MNTTDFLNIANAICPERDCVVFEGKRQTYDQTSERVNRLANALAGLGVEKGDRIAVLQVNCGQYVESYFAAAKLGAITVPLNFRAKQDELGYMLENAEAKVLLAGDRYLDITRAVLPQLPTVRQCIAIDSKQPDMLYYEDLIREIRNWLRLYIQ